ncbi:MAG: LON peptidase substrate-binding domain-containing protein [bacterium]
MNKIYIFPLSNLVIIPGNIIGVIINDDKLLENIKTNMKFITSMIKDEKSFTISEYGCLCEIVNIQRISFNVFIVQLKASKRVKIIEIEFEDIYPYTKNYQIIEEKIHGEYRELVEKIINLANNYIPQLKNELIKKSIKEKNLCSFTDTIVSIMKLNPKVKQTFLEEIDCKKRAIKLIEILEEINKKWPGKIITLKSFLPKPLTTVIYSN